MHDLAALPPGAVRSEDATDCTDMLGSLLAIAVGDSGGLDGHHLDMRCLSDLGRLLEAQPPLRRHVRFGTHWVRRPKLRFRTSLGHRLRRFVHIMFNRVITVIDMNKKVHGVAEDADLAQLAVAQSRMGYCHTPFWVWLKHEHRSCGTPETKEFADIVHAAAQLQEEAGSAWPARALHEVIQQLPVVYRGDGRMSPPADGPNVASVWGAPKMLWAYAKLELVCMPQNVAIALVDTTMEEAPRMGPEDVVATWWALAELFSGLGPAAAGDRGTAPLIAATVRVAPDLRPSAVTAMWSAFSRMVPAPPTEARDALYAATARAAPAMHPLDLDRTWAALATLGAVIPEEAHRALCVATVRFEASDAPRTWRRTHPENLENAWWALTALRPSSRGEQHAIGVDLDALYAVTASAYLTAGSCRFPAALAATVHCFALLQQEVPAATLPTLSRSLLRSVPFMTPPHIALVTWALRELAWPADPAGTEEFSELRRHLKLHADFAADAAVRKTAKAKATLEALTASAADKGCIRRAQEEVTAAAVRHRCQHLSVLAGQFLVHQCACRAEVLLPCEARACPRLRRKRVPCLAGRAGHRVWSDDRNTRAGAGRVPTTSRQRYPPRVRSAPMIA